MPKGKGTYGNMGDISRRNFLKGTGKTILTAGALSSGVLTTSSTPVKTATTATTTWKNLNVLSPKAKAYRGFLKGMIGGAISVSYTHLTLQTKS